MQRLSQKPRRKKQDHMADHRCSKREHEPSQDSAVIFHLKGIQDRTGKGEIQEQDGQRFAVLCLQKACFHQGKSHQEHQEHG